jgi:hypothetical protein
MTHGAEQALMTAAVGRGTGCPQDGPTATPVTAIFSMIPTRPSPKRPAFVNSRTPMPQWHTLLGNSGVCGKGKQRGRTSGRLVFEVC